jgi:NitT/TauT family transport system substrate-binding protein
VVIHVGVGTQDSTSNCAAGGTLVRELRLFEKYLPHTGKYANATYDVEWKNFTSGPPLTSDMLADKVDIGMMGDFPAVLNGIAFREKGKKSYYVATLSGSVRGGGNGIVVPGDSPARTLADLKGKTISVPFGSAAHGMLLRAIRDLGWDPERDVALVSQSPEVGGSSLQSHKVDAHADFVPFAELFPFRGYARKIYDGSTTNTPTSHGILVRGDFAEKYPEIVVAYLEAALDADRLFAQQPEKYSELTAKVSGVDAEVVYMFHGPLGIQTRDYTLKPEYRAGLKTAVGTLKLLKKTERDLDIESFVDDRFIRDAAANLGLDYDARLKSYAPLPLTATDATTHEPIVEPRLAAQVWVGGEDAVRSYASIRHALEALALIESGGKKARIVYVHDRTTGLKLLASTAW